MNVHYLGFALLKDAGYAGLSARDLVELRAHGVEADLLKRLTATRQERAR